MEKRRALLIGLLFSISGLALYGQASALKIEIKAAKTEIKNGGDFSVSTVIRNTGSKEIILGALLCGYCYQWRADVPSVSVGADACTNNAISRIRLEPGGSYERSVVVFISLNANMSKIVPVTFRLGFQDENPQNIPAFSRIWSNAITVNVTR